MIIGGLAGTGFWLAGLPGDRLKSTFQTDLEGRYKSVPHLTKSVLQEWLIYILTKKKQSTETSQFEDRGSQWLIPGTSSYYDACLSLKRHCYCCL